MPSQILIDNLAIEFKTLEAMVRLYCKKHHSSMSMCGECESLLRYAETKLDRCPYGQSKPACNRCPIHCYKPEPKEKMRAIMRFSGPRMLLYHPRLAIRHLLHERKNTPPLPSFNASNRAKRAKQAK